MKTPLTINSLLTFIIVSISCLTVNAQNNVGIGTTTPNTKAILELKATDKGLLVPRLTTLQMNAIAPTAAEKALLIYNTDSACYHFYNGLSWINMCKSQGKGGTDTAAINKAIKNYLSNVTFTTIVNNIKIDSSVSNYSTTNISNVNILNVDTSVTNVSNTNISNVNILNTDTTISNYTQATNASFTNLTVGGQTINTIMTDSIKAQAWLLKGNNNTAANNKLGTLNNRDLHIVAGNATDPDRITILNGTGNVGIGQTLPAQRLDVLGNVQFSGALMPAALAGATGQVLVSQGVGVAPTWVAPGSLGTTGTPGNNALSKTTAEPAGINCATGGQKIETGVDNNTNNVLDASEITATNYVCNGATGPAGPTGAAGSNGAAGTNGTNGQNTLIKTTAEPAGVNCATGGQKIETGIDTNNSGVLDAGEVTASAYVCNGVGGAGGASSTGNGIYDVAKLHQGTTGRTQHFVVLSDGSVLGWGTDGNGEIGDGDENTNAKNVPMLVNLPGPCREVIVENYSTYFIMQNGDLYSCGYNGYGQLGVGSLVAKYSPTKVLNVSNVVKVATSMQTMHYSAVSVCALSSTGQLWCWGYNAYGQVGDATNVDKNSPVSIFPNSVIDIEGSGGNGGSFCCIKSDSTMACWGYNPYGALGIGTTTNANTPQPLFLLRACLNFIQ